ncbi:ATP-dependent RNA helicase DHX58 isoform X1 [Melanerpes formicivorus]|uniref:ATP-dependent RNA helicase DHX58 isoform X1 n=1 Tax=Melanerpes formicivorus TaxID=211600 RepID=UPI00358FA5DD
MELRGYQREAAAPALRGRNCIIWLPTGAGKTRVAAHVCRQHLQSRSGAKVAFLVNKVHLVEQHAQKEFHELQKDFKVAAVSGESSHKTFFAEVVRQSDVVICTAQILLNALRSGQEDTHVELPDFSLLVIDECHHTHKDAVYNRIMLGYLQRKLDGQQDLPQVLGLTASPGTGGATTLEGAIEHILQICANLDTEEISSAQEEVQQLQSQVPQPRKQHDLCQERVQDPFGERLKKIMEQIHEYMEMPDLPRDFGTQMYEQRIVELEKAASEGFCRGRRLCALALRRYNDALLVSDAVRMVDAFQCLQQFYADQGDAKDPTERFLNATFEENRESLQALAGDQRYKNPRLSKLEEILQEHFQPLGTSRGIVFTKTRQSAHSLLSWLQDTAALRHIRAAVLTGAGCSNQTKAMTQNEQQDTIKRFREGALNLLFSTSVAEEGLDIPECNIVVRYGLMTNEIAMVQIRELQQVAVAIWQLKEAKLSQRQRLHDPGTVRLYCTGCGAAVCQGSHIRTVEGTHHVSIHPGLSYRVSSGKMHFQRTFRDWEPGCRIACSQCSQDWGLEMIYRQVKLPILCIKSFVVETPAERRRYKKWSAVTFPIEEFDYTEYCCSTHSQSF